MYYIYKKKYLFRLHKGIKEDIMNLIRIILNVLYI